MAGRKNTTRQPQIGMSQAATCPTAKMPVVKPSTPHITMVTRKRLGAISTR